jgi:cysteine-rich repeat protein
VTGATTTIRQFSNLSDMCMFVVSPQNNRWYFHYEGSGQFGGSSETLGFCSSQLERCGDNVVQGANGETCDDGNLSNGDGCSATCHTEACGNGFLEIGEQCDDGNVISGDGCRGDCHVEGCGDGIVQAPETCDDNNIVSGDGCNSLCIVEACGNQFIEPNETCDDGNTTNGDGCSSLCRLEACGNNVTDFGEECDDGNQINADGCNSNCESEFCGDGIVQSTLNEDCDDGNLINGDGCDATCLLIKVTLPYLENFDDGIAQQFLFESEDNISWQVDTARFTSATRSLYMGNPITHTYEDGTEVVDNSALTPFFDVPVTGADVSFQLFQATEGGIFFDEFSVVIFDGNQNAIETVLQRSQTTGGAFIPVTFQIPSNLAGLALRIGFFFTSKDAFQNNFEGIYIDDLRIEAAP